MDSRLLLGGFVQYSRFYTIGGMPWGDVFSFNGKNPLAQQTPDANFRAVPTGRIHSLFARAAIADRK